FYYKLVVPNSVGSMIVQLTANTGGTSLYISRGVLPTPYNYDYHSFVAGHQNQSLVYPTTVSGTYYVLVRAESGITAPTQFSVNATIPSGIQLTSIGKNTGGNSGNVTVAINGLNMTPNTTAQLVQGGTVINAASIDFRSGALIYATFNLTGQ